MISIVIKHEDIEEDEGNRPELPAWFRMVVIEDRVAGHQKWCLNIWGLGFRVNI